MKIIIVFLLKKGPYLRIGFKFFAINILALKQITFYIFFAILMPQNGIMSRCTMFVCFVALRPKSTAMVMAGRSVHLTTFFPGQA